MFSFHTLKQDDIPGENESEGMKGKQQQKITANTTIASIRINPIDFIKSFSHHEFQQFMGLVIFTEIEIA